MTTTTPATTYTSSPLSVQYGDGSEESASPTKFDALRDFGNAYFEERRSKIEFALANHYELPSHLFEATTDQAVDLMRKYPDVAEVSEELIERALVVVIRHQVIPGDLIKDNLAKSLGGHKLKEKLSSADYGEVHRHINAIARILIRNLCNDSNCCRHSMTTFTARHTHRTAGSKQFN